jgi:hypothetical protein
MIEKSQEVYQRIANYLLLHSYSSNNISLYHGKTGIVLAMMMYSKVSDNLVLKEYSEDLFQTIYKDIHEGMPIGIEHGLAGVGYGISLMKEAQLIDCDLNDVLYDIDAKIMNYNPMRISDFSFRMGISGVFAYINLRKKVEGIVSSFDECYMRQLSIIYQEKKEIIDVELNKNIFDDLECPDWDEASYIDKSLGLEHGCSYFLFYTCYDKLFRNS